MDEEIICRFLHWKAHKTPTRPIEISSFKHNLCGEHPFNSCPNKEVHFHMRFLDFPNGRKIGTIPIITKPLTDSERTFRVTWPTNLRGHVLHDNIFQECHPEKIRDLNLERLIRTTNIMPEKHPKPNLHFNMHKGFETFQSFQTHPMSKEAFFFCPSFKNISPIFCK